MINQGWTNDFFDTVLPFMRNKRSWIPLYLICIGWILYRYRKTSWIPLLAVLVTMTVSDTMSSKIIKKSVKRPRPCHVINEYPETIVRSRCGGGYSFTSSHATNHFTLAMILPMLLGFRKRWVKIDFLIWAAVISLSQIYVGVHYPIDIICGTLLGVSIGTIAMKLYRKYGYPHIVDALNTRV